MEILLDLTIAFALAAVVLYFSARLKIPTIVGLLLSGLIAGPYGLEFVRAEEEVEVMAEIGILLLLFTIGMEFSLKKLLQSKKWIFIGGGIQVAGTIGLVSLLATATKLDYTQAVFMGCLFAMSSTAIVLHLLQEKGWMERVYGKAALSILIFQDIAIIPIMLLAPFLAGSGGSGWDALTKLSIGVLLVTIVIVLARRFVPRLLARIVHTRNQELFLMATLVICFATAFITNLLGLKLALGAFLAGLIVSESEYCMDALRNILPLKKIFTSIFFISIGMLLNTGFLVQYLLPILGIVVLVLLLKALVVLLLGLGLRLSLENALITAITLCQVGEFAFILSAVGNEYALLTDQQYQVFLAVSILSMAIAPFLIVYAPKLAHRLVTLSWLRRIATRAGIKAVAKADPGCPDRGHLVIIGFGPGGQRVAGFAREKGMPYAVVELNTNTVDYHRDQGEPIFAGDARDGEVLRNAATDKARTVVITVPGGATAEAITSAVRKINPNAHLVVRTQFESEVEVLKKLGADEVIPAETEAAQRINKSLQLQFD